MPKKDAQNDLTPKTKDLIPRRNCPICGGNLEDGTTTYTADLDFGLVVVRKVPAKVCSQCGEDWIDPDIASKLEETVAQAREKGTEFEVITYNSKVAS
ncbi:MAG: type II toxin-antitoxin system MqsA family antitoxin [Candidatus Bipolaricaulia bacterium]